MVPLVMAAAPRPRLVLLGGFGARGRLDKVAFLPGMTPRRSTATAMFPTGLLTGASFTRPVAASVHAWFHA
jgi:hypothetical protein